MKKIIILIVAVAVLSGCSPKSEVGLAKYRLACLNEGGRVSDEIDPYGYATLDCTFTYPNLPSSH